MRNTPTRAGQAILVSALLAGALGAARAEGLYVGGSVGAPDYHSRIAGVDGGGSGTGLKLYGGYAFDRHLALEAGAFELGHIDNASGKANARGAFLDVVGFMPLTDKFSLLGSAGMAEARWQTSNGDDSSPAWKFGAGLQYDLGHAVALRAQYERYQSIDAFGARPGVGETTVGLNYRF